MEWRDEGLVIGARRHGESSVILEVMTAAHGRHLGLVRGGRSRRMQPVLQAGNGVEAVWRARIDEHLGMMTVEATRNRAARLMQSQVALHGLSWLGQLLHLLPEREPHPRLYETAVLVCDHLDEPAIAPALMVRFELALLQELGFGLDLSECAATGATQELVYVSPKSGRAVCRAAGLPWHGKLLALPGFLQEGARGEVADADLADGFRLTGYFLARDLFGPRGGEVPQARADFVRLAAVRTESLADHDPMD